MLTAEHRQEIESRLAALESSETAHAEAWARAEVTRNAPTDLRDLLDALVETEAKAERSAAIVAAARAYVGVADDDPRVWDLYGVLERAVEAREEHA